MASYCLTCCSTADLTKERLDARGIKYVCFHFTIDGVEYCDDLWQSMRPQDLFNAMSNGAETKTSQACSSEYIELFEPILAEGKDLLHVTLSSGISGSYNSAVIAANELREKYPERKIYVVDSLGASSGYGLIMETLADFRDRGADIDSLYEWIMKHRLNMHHWFFSTDLTYYIKGGRVSKTSGFFGNMLGICPLLNMDNNGKLIPREKIIGKKRVIRRTVEKMTEFAKNGCDYDGKVFICQSECMDDARTLAALVKEKFPLMNGEPEIFPIGAVIGSHTGPGTISLFFWGKKRNN